MLSLKYQLCVYRVGVGVQEDYRFKELMLKDQNLEAFDIYSQHLFLQQYSSIKQLWHPDSGAWENYTDHN